MQCQWNQGSFLGQLPWRHWRGLPGQGRPDRSYLGSTGAYPLLAGLGAPWLSPSGALSLSTLLAHGSLSGLFKSPFNSSWRGFGPPSAHPPWHSRASQPNVAATPTALLALDNASNAPNLMVRPHQPRYSRWTTRVTRLT